MVANRYLHFPAANKGSLFVQAQAAKDLNVAPARGTDAGAMHRLNPSRPPFSSPASGETRLLKDEIFELLHSCIKLANENKINHKNAWELKLIDHLTDIVNFEADDGVETNFRTASCSLEAGVKIYSVRVDALHSEAYKVLGGISVASLGYQEDIATSKSHNVSSEQHRDNSEETPEKKVSPLSTLESSIEALNWNRLESVAAVDPSYHRTSLLMIQGGAESLLLINVGVYGGCRLLFDSFEVPGRNESCIPQSDISDVIDILFAKDSIEQMVINLPEKMEISPTLRDIVCLLNETRQMPFEKSSSIVSDNFCISDDLVHDDESQSHNHSFENSENTFQENDHCDASIESDVSPSYEEVAIFLFPSVGIAGKQNSWAGPDYWKFQKPKVQKLVQTVNNGFACSSTSRRNRSGDSNDVDFTKSMDCAADIFAPPANPMSLLLPADRVPSSHSLPEDKHYQSLNLVTLFLRPDLQFLERRRRVTLSDSTSEFYDPDEASPSRDYGNASGLSGQHGDGYFHEVVEPEELISHRGLVNEMEVQHAKAFEQVDLRALKETLWEYIQEESARFPAMTSQEWSDPISFKQLLATYPVGALQNKISPQLCFICLLHLGNEIGLKIQGCSGLDDVIIHLPRPSDVGH